MSSVAARLAQEAAQKRQLELDLEAKAAEAALAAEASPEELDDEDGSETSPVDEDSLDSLLSALPGGPSVDQIESWRKTYNSVYALSLRDDDWYVWRYLQLGEWRDIQSRAGSIAPDLIEDFYKAQVLRHCLVWPREKVLDPVEANKLPANLINLLYEVVMAGSYFMPADQALRQTIRL